MKDQEEREARRRDLLLVLLIVPLSILCMFLTGQLAIKLDPFWELPVDLGSNLDPNVDFAAEPIQDLMEPINPNILTQPVWEDLFLTPNAVIPTRIIPTNLPTPLPQPTAQPTAVIPTAIPTLVPTLIPPPTFRPPPKPTNPPPPEPTNPPPLPPSADLSIANTNVTNIYRANDATTYEITVSNLSGSNVTGATVTDTFSNLLTNINWTCVPTGAGASCTTGPVTGDINDTVNLPVGTFITYTVTADVIAAPSGDLVNTATVAVPPGYVDPDGSNNSATDTDVLFDELPTTPDGIAKIISEGSVITLNVTTVVNGDVGAWDLIYYEYPSGPAPQGILLDWVQIEIGDGTNWYPVFNWGDNVRDTNTNVDFTLLPPPSGPPLPPPEEPDERIIPANFGGVDVLYNNSGVAIDLDPVAPAGTYPYLRITAPIDGNDGQLEFVDIVAITP